MLCWPLNELSPTHEFIRSLSQWHIKRTIKLLYFIFFKVNFYLLLLFHQLQFTTLFFFSKNDYHWLDLLLLKYLHVFMHVCVYNVYKVYFADQFITVFNSYMFVTLLAGLRICCFLFRKVSPTTQKWCPEYNTKLHLMVKLQIWRVWSTFLLLLFSGSLCPGVVAPVRFSSMEQIFIFNRTVRKKKTNNIYDYTKM